MEMLELSPCGGTLMHRCDRLGKMYVQSYLIILLYVRTGALHFCQQDPRSAAVEQHKNMPLCNWKVSLYLVFLLVSSALQIPVKQNVWTTFGDLAVKTGACNLGQGYPDWDTPDFVLESLHKATKHQYTRPSGYPDLASLLSTRYFTHLNHEVNPMSEIAITVGASQALYLALATMLKEGDEVVMFDPYFELYAKQIALTKATPVFVQLGGRSATTQNPWALDIETLKR